MFPHGDIEELRDQEGHPEVLCLPQCSRSGHMALCFTAVNHGHEVKMVSPGLSTIKL